MIWLEYPTLIVVAIAAGLDRVVVSRARGMLDVQLVLRSIGCSWSLLESLVELWPSSCPKILSNWMIAPCRSVQSPSILARELLLPLLACACNLWRPLEVYLLSELWVGIVDRR